MENIKKNFIRLVQSNKSKLRRKPRDALRVATYNVHYWTDINEKNSLKNIMNDIKTINADIICLQEVVFGVKYKVRGETINTEGVVDMLYNLGYYTIFCNVLPTWFGGIFGNMMCVKLKYKDMINDTNHTFSKSKKSCIVSGNKEGTKETRCFIGLELMDCFIIGVHLDVCSEAERKNQIRYILKQIQKHRGKRIILMGDFNSTDISQYKDKGKRKSILQYVFNNNYYQMNHSIIKKLKKNLPLSRNIWIQM